MGDSGTILIARGHDPASASLRLLGPLSATPHALSGRIHPAVYRFCPGATRPVFVGLAYSGHGQDGSYAVGRGLSVLLV